MASSKKDARPARPPAKTPEARELQLTGMSFDLAEQQLLDGTASAQIITHFLKLGTVRESLEREKLARENELLRAKSEAIASTARVEELYSDAMKAFKSYKGIDDMEMPDE